MPEASQRVHVIIHGRVHGVGYRFFVVEEAHRQGVRGWVRNLPDGTVEAVAEGARPALDGLLAALADGPSGARVTDVAVRWETASGEFEDFRVRRP
ncbi:MAG: hypothetical protein A2Y93_14195 [Chloroflexi bacterium RBG_13_68_17]|nr:MAG: hypothetical protein A2Y93_14195 [Chloroflexi bacterium RBG_13_68_17]